METDSVNGRVEDRDDREASAELEAAKMMGDMLMKMQGQFQKMSEVILGRIDQMGNRIDELETTIGDLMSQAGVEPSDLMTKDSENSPVEVDEEKQ